MPVRCTLSGGAGETDTDTDTDTEDSNEAELRGVEYWFGEGMEFTCFADFLQRKKAYSENENVHLVVNDAHKLKTNYDDVLRPYDRVKYSCQFGPKRKPRGKGIRDTKTSKIDCPFVLRLGYETMWTIY